MAISAMTSKAWFGMAVGCLLLPCAIAPAGQTDLAAGDANGTPQSLYPLHRACPADVTKDGKVDIDDVFEVLASWGACPDDYDMVPIPAGEFEMGRHVGDGEADELPVHAVYIDEFYMSVYETTNAQYCAYLNAAWAQGLIEVNGGLVYKAGDSEPYCDTFASSSYSRIHWDGSSFSVTADKEDHPMVEVSWYGAVAYCNWRSAEEGLQQLYQTDWWECIWDGNGYRLPTEAEWEYAARGGLHNPYRRYPWGDDIDGSKANYWESGDPYEKGPQPWTTPVGYYDGNQVPPGDDIANGYGLYDVTGNVWEWCNDWYQENYYENSPYDNPHGPSNGTSRVVRGGGWYYGPEYCRSAGRIWSEPGTRGDYSGFRIVLDLN